MIMSNSMKHRPTRRDILKNSAALTIAGALAAPLIVPKSVRAAGTDLIKVGLIGCGGGGRGGGQEAMNADENVAVTGGGGAFSGKRDKSQAAVRGRSGGRG